MIKIRAIGATILVIVAVFFLLVANNTNTIFFDNRFSVLATRPEPTDLGHVTNGNDFLLSKDVDLAPIDGQSVSSETSLIRIALIYTNITKDAYMIALTNNSRLNAKTNVFVLAQTDNVTVNGNRLNNNDMVTFGLPLPLQIAISYNGSMWYININRVQSLDDIPDEDRTPNTNASYLEIDLVRVALVGIPAVLSALATSIAILAFIKEERIQEGLPNEL